MTYDYRRGCLTDGALRASFNRLTREVFGFDFEKWHAQGYWTDSLTSYRPNMLLDGGAVVANVSETRLRFSLDGRFYDCIQLGTVMTDPAYRGRGLSRRLMETVLAQDCDLFYLYANDSVLDFYPKFGFRRVREYAFSCAALQSQDAAVRADMTDRSAREKLIARYAQGNPFSAVESDSQIGLLMFYCAGFMKNSVYFMDDLSAAAVAEYDGNTMTLCDVFCPPETPLEDVLSRLCRPETERIEFGFTPRDSAALTAAPIEGDDALFVLPRRASLFEDRPVRLPLLTHT